MGTLEAAAPVSTVAALEQPATSANKGAATTKSLV
jgi:hypothetical protein